MAVLDQGHPNGFPEIIQHGDLFSPVGKREKVVPGLDFARLGLVVEDADSTPRIGKAEGAFRIHQRTLVGRVDVFKPLQCIDLGIMEQTQFLHDVPHVDRRKHDVIAGGTRLYLCQHFLVRAIGVEGNLNAGLLGKAGQNFRIDVVAPVVDIELTLGKSGLGNDGQCACKRHGKFHCRETPA